MAGSRRVPWWAWVAGAVVVAGGTVVALGGLNDVPVQALPRIELGEEYSTNAIDVTVERVVLSDSTPFNEYTEDGKQYVIVEVEATATTDEPSIFGQRLIRVLLGDLISPNDPNSAVEYTELRNGGYGGALQPGLPTRLAYSWEIPAGSAEPGDEIIVGIFEQQDRPDDPIFEDAKSTVAVVRIVTELEEAP